MQQACKHAITLDRPSVQLAGGQIHVQVCHIIELEGSTCQGHNRNGVQSQTVADESYMFGNPRSRRNACQCAPKITVQQHCVADTVTCRTPVAAINPHYIQIQLHQTALSLPCLTAKQLLDIFCHV